ncbi:hypothetical protein CEE36_08845 [candidate division TA06 bacterium B3_TA06]|uniref:Uncharacterized protein n=1 Tax=candidate division TA06 bacterium B3_TA06 TaxID=2012487 RepID=A0A532V171_UNCT6|nr:MAG: hypothetical protein CEE36_08845 [candidate division TA06 bacterium B3_TA06]
MDDQTVVEEQESVISGKVESVIDHGTIIQMLVKTDDGSIRYVNWDHRMFFNMAECIGHIPRKGEFVIIHGEPFEQSVEFPDLMEDEP